MIYLVYILHNYPLSIIQLSIVHCYFAQNSKKMGRLKELFDRKKTRVLNMYCTAGYPKPDDTLLVMKALQLYGADLIELGMPYSDPLADGPVIQISGGIALEGGMTINKLFQQLENFRSTIHVPVLLMGYMNPVLQYGFEKFCKEAASIGIDGIILPDLPMYEFDAEYGEIIKQNNLDFIFLVTPETSDERIKELDKRTTGFLYAVSSSSTTGTDKDFVSVSSYLKKLQNLQLSNPILVGFGIKDKQSFDDACAHSNGAIIGTAYIKALEKADDVDVATRAFLQKVLG